jgi:hypothetical protein
VKLTGYVTVHIPGGIQYAYTSVDIVRDGRAYDIPRPCFELIDGIVAMPVIGYRAESPTTELVLDLGRWMVVDMKMRARSIVTEFIPTDDPNRLLPLAERYIREARHLDSLGVEQWFNRLMNDASTEAHVVKPALGSGR